MLKSNIELFIGEVIENDTVYQVNDSKTNTGEKTVENNETELFTIKVKIDSTKTISTPIFCKPANLNIKQIPQIGEMVLVFKAYNNETYINEFEREQWYYMSVISSMSRINNNFHPLFTQQDQSKQDIQKNISIRQPYHGDVLLQGRFGTSLRLGNTHKPQTEAIPRLWGGDDDGSPIVILSTYNKPNSVNDVKLNTEDINNDDSSVYLTTTQKLYNFDLNHNVRTTQTEKDFTKSQFIGTADRVILKSKTDSIILDSNRSIEINTPLLYIGTSKDKEPLLHSTAVESILKKILMVLAGGFRDSSGVSCYPILNNLLSDNKMQTSLERLLNQNIWTDKYKG
tara:strand:- start:278 stop:1300 length:1023 start_codon:yes stop_codon:yes gene_type:complete